jgi:phage tail sheath protein FI
MHRYAYCTPGVYFEWLDTRVPALVPLRTDIAGFVGIAARGPLHQPVEVESWTQFISTFGVHVPQGYLAYAVEGFFANGGKSCWVVRVANPDQAQAAALDLLEVTDKPELWLRLNASNPGVWGEKLAVRVTGAGRERFAVAVQLQDGAQEQWRNLSMRLASFDFRDGKGLPTMRLEAYSPELQESVQKKDASVTLRRTDATHFTLSLQVKGRRLSRWENLTMDPNSDDYIEKRLNTANPGSQLMVAHDLRSSSVPPHNTPDPHARNLREGNAVLQPDPRYVGTVINDPATGSRLVTVENLSFQTKPSGSSSSSRPRIVRGGTGHLLGGFDGLAPILELKDSTGQKTLRLTAKYPGAAKDLIQVKVAGSTRNRFSLTIRRNGVQEEKWSDLSMDPEEVDPDLDPQQRHVEIVLNRNKGSRLVTARDLNSEAGYPRNTPDPDASDLSNGEGELKGGLVPAHLGGDSPNPDKPWGLATLKEIDQVSMVAIPDIMPKPIVKWKYAARQARCHVLDVETLTPRAPERDPEYPPKFDATEILYLQHALVRHCEELKDRVAILDMLSGGPEVALGEIISWRNQFDTKYAALYFPWLKVPDPLRLNGLLRTIPPSGHVAGVYARGDLTVGVHDIYHGELNVSHVNAIRVYNGRGVRIGGARTLSSDPEWRFVNVRRLLIMIEEAVEEQMQWTVFEPNNPALWRDIDRVVRSFLDTLWRLGMLDGAAAQDAYHVRCDEVTNPPRETDQGRMICEIGVRPPWPAEFVIVRIGFTGGGVEIIEE